MRLGEFLRRVTGGGDSFRRFQRRECGQRPKRNALDGDKCFHAVDAINDGQSWRQLSEALALEGSRLSVYLPRLDYISIPPSPEVGVTFFGTVHGQPTPCWDQKCEEDVDFAYVLFRLLGKWLSEGKINGHPYVLLPNVRASVEEGLIQLKEGLVSAKKLIYKVADAPVSRHCGPDGVE